MSVLDITNEISAGLKQSFRGAADQLVNALIKSGRQSANEFFAGPKIPFPISELNRREQLGLSFGVFRFSHLIQTVPVKTAPVAASIAFAPALLHAKEYGLFHIGLNPGRVLERGEWHRLVTSQLVNGTIVQFLDNANDLYESGSWLEKRWGWQGLVGAVGAVASLAPSLYVAFTAFANRVAPSSALAQQYYSAYFVSPSMLALGISVLSGYDKDVYAVSRGAAGNGGHDQVWAARYNWGPRLLMTAFLAPSGVGYLEPNICGIVAGLLCVYAFGVANPRWRQRGGLGLTDLAIQGALLGFLGLASYMSSKNTGLQMRA